MLKNPSSLSFRGVRQPTDDGESLNSFVSRARFLPFALLRVGMTRHSLRAYRSAEIDVEWACPYSRSAPWW
jgi:hypothetical protein